MSGAFSVGETLRGKHILMTGVTGFVGKAFFAWVLYHHPDVRRITCIVRPKSRQQPVERLKGVLDTAALRILRDQHAEGFDAFIASKVGAVSGDLSKPKIGLSPEDIAGLKGDVDILVNVAASVDFTPPLNDAVQTNVEGALGALELARELGVPFAHVSTCYVAGYASGWVPEAVDPSCPNKDIDNFDPEKELVLVQRVIQRIIEDREDPTQPPPRRRLRTEGEARSRALGWPNTYTYTKSLAEKLLTQRKGDVPLAIVRPAIVESAWKFPLTGWSEGGNGSAACLLLALLGQRWTPAKDDLVMDLVPVDLVAKGLVLAACALLRGEHQPVYQLGTSDANPLPMHRLVELVNTWKYTRAAEEGRGWTEKLWMTHSDAVSGATTLYERASVPAIRKASSWLSGVLGKAPAPDGVARRLTDRAKAVVDAVERTARGVESTYDVYRPFAFDVDVRYKTANVVALGKRVVPEERDLYEYGADKIDWYRYFHDVHLPGLDEWIWPEMERKLRQGLVPDPPPAPQFPGDLLDLFERSVAEHGTRPCFSKVGEGVPSTMTYDEVHDRARLVGRRLVAAGVTPGDRVLVAVDRGVEWPLTWLGVLYAGGVAVPIDPATPADTVAKLAERAQVRVWVVSRALRKIRDAATAALLKAEELTAPSRGVEDLPAFHPFKRAPDRVASILFTSGTTGSPRGVVLAHANFLAVLKGIWHVYEEPGPEDRFLSLLPLHHSFEFVAGLLFPIARGASIAYPVRVTAETLPDLLADVRPTCMVGVPAVWTALQRQISRKVDDLPLPARQLWRLAEKRSGQLRDELGINVGPLLFFPVRSALGGDLKHLVSGGAALPEAVLRDFYRWGFSLTSGYGLTEAAPVLTVAPPGTRRGDSVGPAIHGVDVKIDSPGPDGVGEVIAKGPNVMKGYLDDVEGTQAAIKGGWLRTGDLGRLDKDGHLVLVGRKKEVIVAASGENVYPDELEERLVNLPDVDELSVVGLPDGHGGEKVAAVVILVEDAAPGVEAGVRRAIGERCADLPSSWRPTEIRFRKEKLPRTATQKVSRARLIEQEALRAAPAAAEVEVIAVSDDGRWLVDAMARAAHKPTHTISATTRLGEDLPLDSLAWMDLASLIERRTGNTVAVDELAAMGTVGEVVEAVTGKATRKRGVPRVPLFYGSDGRPMESQVRSQGPVQRLPDGVRKEAQTFVRRAHAAISGRLLDVEVTGQAFLPDDRAVLVVSNHVSHVDSGVLRHALGKMGDDLPLLAAQDYFFGTPVKDLIFGDLLDLVPADRHKTGLAGVRSAVRILEGGRSLAIFPEGTRSRDGDLLDFKPGAVLIALQARVDILLVHVDGTHDVLPVGGGLPRVGTSVRVRIGRPVPFGWIERAVRDEGASMQDVADILREGVLALSRGGDSLAPWARRSTALSSESTP